jgi:hypothetical protein
MLVRAIVVPLLSGEKALRIQQQSYLTKTLGGNLKGNIRSRRIFPYRVLAHVTEMRKATAKLRHAKRKALPIQPLCH